jgi:integrase/recombinase XerC
LWKTLKLSTNYYYFINIPFNRFTGEEYFFTLLLLMERVDSMTDLFLQYLQFEKRVSPHTVQAYQSDLAQVQVFIQHTFHNNTLASATYNELRAWIVELMNDGLDPRSINRKIACLRSFYKFLHRENFIAENPTKNLKILKTAKKIPSFLQEDEILSLLDQNTFDTTFEAKRDQLMLELFYGTGIRLAELLSLTDKAINTYDRTIKVLGKRNKERIIPYTQTLSNLLESYWKARNQEVEKKPHGLLFVTKNGDPCYPMLVYRIVKSYLRHMQVEKKSPHVLRHTYATHLLNKGAEINAVKELLGHSSLAATQVYTHNTIEKLKKVFEQAHPKA